MKWFIALQLKDARVFVASTGEYCTGFDSEETHAVVLLLSIAEVDDDVRDLLNVFRELHFFVI